MWKRTHRHQTRTNTCFKGRGEGHKMIPYSWGIKSLQIEGDNCQASAPLVGRSLLVLGPRLISHLLAPISQSVTLPATWNLQLHLGLLKKARQPKWRRCSQWRLTCPVARCKIRGWKGGRGEGGWHNIAFLPAKPLCSLWHHHLLSALFRLCIERQYISRIWSLNCLPRRKKMNL